MDLPELTALSRLKVVAFESNTMSPCFERSFERHAMADYSDLQVHLFSVHRALLTLSSQPLLSRVVRFETEFDFIGHQVPLLCTEQKLRSLISLSVVSIGVAEVVPLFTALAHLHQLIHLQLRISLKMVRVLAALPLPLTPVNSVRALELSLSIPVHCAAEKLNRLVTLL